ncbi:hypothetical protein [Rhodococcus sp. YH1]|uniref:hypothetical protein n=1 Tax=Rhodococcus sp. YH1 TaxID=89066 RepID=UPI001386C6E2|nr:hypothetical protein [Rhodococcus sp. YH1]NCL78913.1 hypothetical protein [Rhodococcus sp. YH1]
MSAPAWTPQLLDRLEVHPAWQVLEDTLADVVQAWVAVEDGDTRKAERVLASLVARLRAHRSAIEDAAAGAS